jgi:hypothetical protein
VRLLGAGLLMIRVLALLRATGWLAFGVGRISAWHPHDHVSTAR